MYTEEVIEVQLLAPREVQEPQETLEDTIHQTEEALDLQDQLEVITLMETDQSETQEDRLEALDLVLRTVQEDKLEVTTLTETDLRVTQELE